MWMADGQVVDLGSLGDGNRFSQAFGINDSNIVVGSSSTGQTVGQLIGTGSTTSIARGFVWSSGVMTELSPFNLYGPGNTYSNTNYHSVAMDVNVAGLVVGNSQRISGSAAVATLWENGIAIDLNSRLGQGSGWILRSAEGINDAGDIVGYGTFNGQTRAFLLSPVPEPMPIALLLAGSALLGWQRVRARRHQFAKRISVSGASRRSFACHLFLNRAIRRHPSTTAVTLKTQPIAHSPTIRALRTSG
jgi:hypothetical protein